MDEKHNHRLDIIKDRRQRKDVKSYMHSISSFLHTQKQSLLTGFLLIVAAILLFGIFSQFQPPGQAYLLTACQCLTTGPLSSK